MGNEQQLEGLPPRRENKKKKRKIKTIPSFSFIATTFLYLIGSVLLFSGIHYIISQNGYTFLQPYKTNALFLFITIIFFVFFGTQFTLHYLYKTFFFNKNKGKVMFSVLIWMLLIPIQIYGLLFLSSINYSSIYFSLIITMIIVHFIYSGFIYLLFLFSPLIFPGTSQKTANSKYIRQG